MELLALSEVEMSQRSNAAQRRSLSGAEMRSLSGVEMREAEMRAGNAFITEDGREAIYVDEE